MCIYISTGKGRSQQNKCLVLFGQDFLFALSRKQEATSACNRVTHPESQQTGAQDKLN